MGCIIWFRWSILENIKGDQLRDLIRISNIWGLTKRISRYIDVDCGKQYGKLFESILNFLHLLISGLIKGLERILGILTWEISYWISFVCRKEYGKLFESILNFPLLLIWGLIKNGLAILWYFDKKNLPLSCCWL